MALEKPPPTDKTIDDNTADLYRAFHVFVREKLIGEKQKQVHSLMPWSYNFIYIKCYNRMINRKAVVL